MAQSRCNPITSAPLYATSTFVEVPIYVVSHTPGFGATAPPRRG